MRIVKRVFFFLVSSWEITRARDTNLHVVWCGSAVPRVSALSLWHGVVPRALASSKQDGLGPLICLEIQAEPLGSLHYFGNSGFRSPTEHPCDRWQF